MSRLREVLAAELAKKVVRHGLVVWDDSEAAYADVAATVVPEGVAFHAYAGSWFALRRAIEPLLSQPARPRLVVYVPARPPAQDPLEEARQAGGRFTMSLRKLLTAALSGELTASRIDQLARQATTLTIAEAALEGGSSVDARLVELFATADVSGIAVAVSMGDRDDRVTAADAWGLVAETLSGHLGGSISSDPGRVHDDLFRRLALVSFHHSGATLPERWMSALAPATAVQVARCGEVLARLREPSRVSVRRVRGVQFDAEMGTIGALGWSAVLAECDLTPGVEEVTFSEAMRLLDAGEVAGAQSLAEARLRSSSWAQVPSGAEAVGPDHPHRRWRALARVASLRRLIDDTPVPKRGKPADVLGWYAEHGWEVDRAHRLAELARADVGHLAGLDRHVTAGRQAYEAWLEAVVTTSTVTIADHGLDVGGLLRQADVYRTVVAGPHPKTAFVLVDALRFELGRALVERLTVPGFSSEVSVRAAVAATPTITPVGMANVMPGADDGLTLRIEGDSVVPYVEGGAVRTVADRVALLRRAAGEVLDLEFNDLMGRSDEQLGVEIGQADLVLVRSGDVDKAGEAGRVGVAWRIVDGLLDELVTQFLRLGRLGVRRIVVTADHGFLVLSQQLSTGRVVARPSGNGELHRRCWIGTGGIAPLGTRRVALADLGVGGGLDLVVPEGLAVFPSAGSRQFFHGGLSPQELVIPVIEMALPEARPAAGAAKVTIVVAGKGITTGVFAATMTFTGDLFAQQVAVRVVARTAQGGSTPVARLVAGDGFDPASGTVTVGADPSVLTFQVTASLLKSTSVELHVLDARSGLELVSKKVPVAAAVTVDDDWP